MPRLSRRSGTEKEVDKGSRRSTRSVKRKAIQVINLTDDEEDEPIDFVKEEHKPKKQKISALRSKIRSFSATPQTTRSPSPDLIPSKAIHTEQWIEKYAPKSVSEVAIHTKKLQEVRECIEGMINGTSDLKVLVLSGPAGASKSTIASCLGKELIAKVRHSSTQDDYVLEYINDSSSGSSVTQFSDFLSSVKYRMGKNLSLILVEDIPNVFHGATREDFQKSILQWCYYDNRTPPLVICITECEFSNDDVMTQGYNIDNNYTAETILSRKLLMNSKVKRIKFNPVNTLLIKKILKTIKSNESIVFHGINKLEIDEKFKELSEFGDIRSSISALQFWAEWKYKNPQSQDLLHIGKEPSISLFHAIGKCIFGTKNEDEDGMMTIDKVMKDFISKPTILKLGLLENYTKFNKSNFELDTAANISNDLSISDLVDSFGSSDTSLEIATRGIRTNFRKITSTESVNSHAGSTFPREWKANGSIAQIKSDISKYIETEFKKRHVFRTFQDSNLIYGFYEPLINKQAFFKNKVKYHYLAQSGESIPQGLIKQMHSSSSVILERLGGPFKQIFGDDDIVPDEEPRDLYFSTVKNNDTSSSSEDLEFDEDPILESEDEIIDFGQDDTFEKELIKFSQKPSLKPENSTLSSRSQRNDEFLNDIDDDFDDSDF